MSTFTVSGLIRSVSPIKLLASSIPFTNGQPDFVVDQPLARPRHNCVGDEHIRGPFPYLVEAENTFPIDVRERFAGSCRELRLNLDSRNRGGPIGDLDGILSTECCRLQRNSPGQDSSPQAYVGAWEAAQ